MSRKRKNKARRHQNVIPFRKRDFLKRVEQFSKRQSEVLPMTTERKTSFITLYFPTEKRFQQAFYERAQMGDSINGQILKLMATDLLHRKIITIAEADMVLNFKFHPTTKAKDGKTKATMERRNRSYSFYVPRDLWPLTLDRVDANLKSRRNPAGLIPYGSRSKYIWSLFMAAYLPNAETSQYISRQAG